MKTIYFLIFVVVLVSLSSCEKNDYNIQIQTNLMGDIKYGAGDCMPIIDESLRVYHNYNGDVYFIMKSELDNLGNGSFEELKANSIMKTVIDGNLNIELPLDTFLIMPSDVYLYSDDNTVIIKNNFVLNKDFKFWKCTSY